MRIAQVAPLYNSVSPQTYGDTERIMSYLIDELVRRDHQVTLFASGDSQSQARLIAPCDRALRLDEDVRDPISHHIVMIERMLRDASEFDLIHFHMDYLHFPLVSRLQLPTLTTLHGRLDNPDLMPLYQLYTDVPVVSLSEAQREPMPWLNWQGTVYPGLPDDLYTFHPEPGHYLAYFGRISPDKQLDHAIEIAQRVQLPLKIAAKVDQVDQTYLDLELAPLLNAPRIEYVGEIADHEKNHFFGQASALLLPIAWPHPSGCAVIEAMACGTPTIAYGYGALPELIEDGVTGYIVDNIGEAVEAVQRIPGLNRKRCREVFEARFTADRMVQDYLRLYDQVLAGEIDHIAA